MSATLKEFLTPSAHAAGVPWWFRQYHSPPEIASATAQNGTLSMGLEFWGNNGEHIGKLQKSYQRMLQVICFLRDLWRKQPRFGDAGSWWDSTPAPPEWWSLEFAESPWLSISILKSSDLDDLGKPYFWENHHISWIYYGFVMKMCYGFVMDLLWIYCGFMINIAWDGHAKAKPARTS